MTSWKPFRSAAPGERRAAPDLPRPDFLAEQARFLRSEQQGLDLLESCGLLQGAGLIDGTEETVLRAVRNLRRQGLGLEPNLLGRAAGRASANLMRCAKNSRVFANEDTDYAEALGEADRARDRREFALAEYGYWKCLVWFPFHSSTLIQYAHTLKEQGKHAEALLRYLDAGLLGAEPADVDQHAKFVADQIGKGGLVEAALSGRRKPDCEALMGRPPLSTEVSASKILLHGRTPTTEECVQYVLAASTIEVLILSMLEDSDFRHMHRDLLHLLAERAGG